MTQHGLEAAPAAEHLLATAGCAILVTEDQAGIAPLVLPGYTTIHAMDLARPGPVPDPADVVIIAAERIAAADVSRVLAALDPCLAPGLRLGLAGAVDDSPDAWRVALTGWQYAGVDTVNESVVVVLERATAPLLDTVSALIAAAAAARLVNRVGDGVRALADEEVDRVRQVQHAAATGALDARRQAERARQQAERARQEAERARQEADGARAGAEREAARAAASAQRATAELARTEARLAYVSQRYKVLSESPGGRLTRRYWDARKRLARGRPNGRG
jgi:hypothetical protein